jgi:hypothetical protein
MSSVDSVPWPSARAALTDERSKALHLRFLPSFRGPRRTFTTLLATVAMVGLGGRLAAGEPAKPPASLTPAAQPSNEELLRNLQCMEQRIRALEGRTGAAGPTAGAPEPAAKSATPPGKPTAAPKTGADPCAPQPKGPSSTQAAKASPPLLPPPPNGSQPAAPPLLPPLPGGPATPGSKGILGVVDSPVAGLSIGAYGEIKYRADPILQRQAPGALQWPDSFNVEGTSH